MSHNGYSNWATWALCLNINNEQSAYNHMRRINSARQLREWVKSEVQERGTFLYDIDIDAYRDIDFEEAFQSLKGETVFNVEVQDDEGDLHFWDDFESLEEAKNAVLEDGDVAEHVISHEDDGEKVIDIRLWP